MSPTDTPEILAIRALNALGQDTRLRVFRELVRNAHTGLAAGEIAERTGVLPNTLSSNLSNSGECRPDPQ